MNSFYSFFLTLSVALVLLGLGSTKPQNGYNYDEPPKPPQTPPSLYETPDRPPPPPPPPRRPSNGYAAPSGPGPVSVDPPGEPMEGMPYDFNWTVEDPDSGNSFSHVETSDGDRTEGQYSVLLPDGRMQTVKFFDDGNGFNAEVTYS